MNTAAIFTIIMLAQFVAAALTGLTQRQSRRDTQDIARILGKEKVFALMAGEIGRMVLSATLATLILKLFL